jgi:outer membrane protein assembly factor BamB
LASGFFSGPAPATGNGVVVASSTDGKVHAYNLTTGTPKWTSAGPSDVGSGSPVVTGSEVLVPAPSALVAYNLNTGGVLWSYPGPCTGNVSTPAISAGTVLFTCTQSGNSPVLVVLGTDGSFRHWFSMAAGTTSAPAIAGGSAYLLLSGSLTSYSLSGFNPKWTDAPPFAVSTDPAVGDGIVVTCGSGGIWAVNVAEGSLRFSDTTFACTASPVIAGGVIYMPRNGDIVMYDEYGNRLGRLGTGGNAGPPAVVDGSVYVEDSLSGVDRFALPGGANPSSAHARPKVQSLHPNRALKAYRKAG